MENKAKAARTALLGAAPAIASTYTGDPSTVTTVLSTQAGAASGLYYNALTESDAELDTAARNSLENFRELFDDIADL
ncbi:MAG: hypothetical protein J07AB43_11530 [Candidatus Nanosalina sp. J07AB43]|nr:MAG: hypothetical protein J07AB43_11530 [Candidatus Nanosalina sp. J07AB43]